MRKLGYLLASLLLLTLTAITLLNGINPKPSNGDLKRDAVQGSTNFQNRILPTPAQVADMFKNSSQPTPGSRNVPIKLEMVAWKYGNGFPICPGDSIWFETDPLSVSWKTAFNDRGPSEKFLLYRDFSPKEGLLETPNKEIPNNKVRGVKSFCIKNLGKEIVRMHAWYGWKPEN